MTSPSITIEDLAARVQALEDQQAITHLLMTHPLAIDGGAGDWWLENWTDDATVDRLQDPERHSGDYAGTYGKDLMRAEIRSPELEALRKSGLCHFVTVPRINVTGDQASATNYLQLVGVEGSSYRVRRIVVSHWELRRENGAWRISKRIMRPLGHGDALDLMTRTIPGT